MAVVYCLDETEIIILGIMSDPSCGKTPDILIVYHIPSFMHYGDMYGKVLRIMGVVICMYDTNKILSKTVKLWL